MAQVAFIERPTSDLVHCILELSCKLLLAVRFVEFGKVEGDQIRPFDCNLR